MNYKELSFLVQIQINQLFVLLYSPLLFSNFLPRFHGNPLADKPPSRARGQA